MLVLSNLKKIALIVILSLSVISCSNDDEAGDVILPSNSIADFVASNPDYSSLNAAIEATNLTGTLSGNSNFTVFAPNNAAFNAFLSTSGFASLDAVPVNILRELLLNHVLAGEIFAANLSTGYVQTASTYSPGDNPLSMYINVGDNVRINGTSTVTQANIEVDNGVIHAVDAVIGFPDITTFALADPTFEILVAALTRDEDFSFVSILQTQEDPAPFTVFAPTNDAFVNFLEEMDFENLAAIPSDVLAGALSYHVVAGANVRSEDITNDLEVATFQSGSFTINTTGGVRITDANERVSNIIATDIQATNGVIHVIDTVLLPEL